MHLEVVLGELAGWFSRCLTGYEGDVGGRELKIGGVKPVGGSVDRMGPGGPRGDSLFEGKAFGVENGDVYAWA